MKIFGLIFIVCLSTAYCDTKLTEDELIILRIEQALESLNSTLCKSDLNATINGYRDRKAWAIASKREKKYF